MLWNWKWKCVIVGSCGSGKKCVFTFTLWFYTNCWGYGKIMQYGAIMLNGHKRGNIWHILRIFLCLEGLRETRKMCIKITSMELFCTSQIYTTYFTLLSDNLTMRQKADVYINNTSIVDSLIIHARINHWTVRVSSLLFIASHSNFRCCWIHVSVKCIKWCFSTWFSVDCKSWHSTAPFCII
jgi:hypothetical protein